MSASNTEVGSPRFEFESLADFGIERAASVLARAFSDYFVKIPFTGELIERMTAVDSIDLAASYVVLRAGEPLGVSLIARRGDRSRLAAMGVVPEARRTGVGRAMVERVVADAQARGEVVILLEVIEQNVPAVKLYEACGFEKIRRLVGFSGGGVSADEAAVSLDSVTIREAAAALAEVEPENTPWQISSETIAQLASPCVAHCSGESWIVLTDPTASPVTIRALGARDGHQVAAQLLRRVMVRYPRVEWRAPPVWPEELAPMFAKAGLKQVELSQWQMIRRLR